MLRGASPVGLVQQDAVCCESLANRLARSPIRACGQRTKRQSAYSMVASFSASGSLIIDEAWLCAAVDNGLRENSDLRIIMLGERFHWEEMRVGAPPCTPFCPACPGDGRG